VFDRQLADLKKFWAGDEVGPPPARERPTLLIGGSSDVALRRAVEHADGWTMGGGTPDQFGEALKSLREAWSAAGRDGQPRTAALFYFSLGDRAEENARVSIGHYYSFLGELADQIVASAAKDADTLKGYLSAFEQAGADEVICFPASSDPAQVELLAEAVGL
jgi:alkanesulfonate monooxygenase SsuD/methylene tetrahydromethanopterin reductase-like flavin-dependent oxidoreductase (luciferase family)